MPGGEPLEGLGPAPVDGVDLQLGVRAACGLDRDRHQADEPVEEPLVDRDALDPVQGDREPFMGHHPLGHQELVGLDGEHEPPPRRHRVGQQHDRPGDPDPEQGEREPAAAQHDQGEDDVDRAEIAQEAEGDEDDGDRRLPGRGRQELTVVGVSRRRPDPPLRPVRVPVGHRVSVSSSSARAPARSATRFFSRCAVS